MPVSSRTNCALLTRNTQFICSDSVHFATNKEKLFAKIRFDSGCVLEVVGARWKAVASDRTSVAYTCKFEGSENRTQPPPESLVVLNSANVWQHNFRHLHGMHCTSYLFLQPGNLCALVLLPKTTQRNFTTKFFLSSANVYQTELHNASHEVASKRKMCVDA